MGSSLKVFFHSMPSYCLKEDVSNTDLTAVKCFAIIQPIWVVPTEVNSETFPTQELIKALNPVWPSLGSSANYLQETCATRLPTTILSTLDKALSQLSSVSSTCLGKSPMQNLSCSRSFHYGAQYLYLGSIDSFYSYYLQPALIHRLKTYHLTTILLYCFNTVCID